MLSGFRLRTYAPVFLLALAALPIASRARQPVPGFIGPQAELPDAPQPQLAQLEGDPGQAQAAATQGQNTQQPVTTPAPEPASSSSQQASPQMSEHDRAEQQLREQERQRAAGIMAKFNTTRNRNAPPLSSAQKFKHFFRSAADPWAFPLALAAAGIGQAENNSPAWGQGMEGYAKRFGASYSDHVIDNFFSRAVLPSLLREDPRYFQKGTGSVSSRIFWAAGSVAWCRRDKGGWGPNYANVTGNFIGAAISRAYYPADVRNIRDTLEKGAEMTVGGTFGAEVIEFWPDLARHFKRKHAEKLARRQAAIDASSASNQAAAGKPAQQK